MDEFEKLIMKYSIVLIEDDDTLRIGGRINDPKNREDLNLIQEHKEKIKSYLKEKNASEKRQRENDDKEYQAGTYPIRVIEKDCDGLILHEALPERSIEPMSELYGNRHALYTHLSLGKHTVGELGQWKALRDKEKSLDDKFQEAKKTNKPVFISSYGFNAGEERGWANVNKYAMPDGTTKEKTEYSY